MEDVSPIENGDIPACYVSLPEGISSLKTTDSTKVWFMICKLLTEQHEPSSDQFFPWFFAVCTGMMFAAQSDRLDWDFTKPQKDPEEPISIIQCPKCFEPGSGDPTLDI